jgi:hypothetical protein
VKWSCCLGQVFGLAKMYQLQRLGTHSNWCVADLRTADLEQLTLARLAQFCFIFADHLATLSLSGSCCA